MYLLLATAAAQASEWHALNIGNFGLLFVDKESLVSDGHTATALAIESPRQTGQPEIYKQDRVSLQDSRVPTQPQEPSPDSKEQWFMKFAFNPNSGVAFKIDGVHSLLRTRAETGHWYI